MSRIWQGRQQGEPRRAVGWTVGDEEDIARNSLQTRVVPVGLPLDRWRSPLFRAAVEVVLASPDASGPDIVQGIADRLGVPRDEAVRQLGETLLTLPVLEGFTQAAEAIARRMIHADRVEGAEREVEMLERVREPGPEDHRRMAEARLRLAALLDGDDEPPEPETLASGFVHPEDGGLPRLRTGFAPFDDATGGGPVLGGVYVLTAAPKVGKTTLAVQIALAHLLADITHSVTMFSCEMATRVLQIRALQHLAQLSDRVLERRDKSPSQRRDLDAGLARFAVVAPRLAILSGERTPTAVIGEAVNNGSKLVVIDYLQRLTPSRPGGRETSRREDVEAVSRELAERANAAGVVVLAVATSPNAAQAAPGQVTLSSAFKEAGAIGFDCAGGWFGSVDDEATRAIGDPTKAVVHWRSLGSRFDEGRDMRLALDRPTLTYRGFIDRGRP